MTGTEVSEALDATVTSPSDIVAIERSRRPVRQAGTFSGATSAEIINDGKPQRIRLKTMLDTGIELEAWWRNESGGVLTTGAVVDVHGVVYGYWA